MTFVSALRSSAFFVVGFAAGWQLDLTCVVSGPSMLPTLQPGDRLLQVPYRCWSLSTWLRSSSRRRSKQQEKENHTSEEHNAGDDEAVASLVSRVVVVRVSEEVSVCKRVVKTTRNANEAVAWHMAALNSNAEEEGSVLYAEDLDDFRHESRDDDDDDDDGPIRGDNLQTTDAEAALDSHDDVRNEGEVCRSAQEAASMEFNAAAASRVTLPSSEWDSCIQQHARSTSAWLWLEGDNPSDSLDSRQAGAVPVECLRSVVVARWWPLTKMTLL